MPAPTEDIGLIAQRAAEDHIERLEIALTEEESGEPAEWPEAGGPYDGCTTCIVRETLWVAWPIIERDVRMSS